MTIVFGYFIWKQNQWIQNDLVGEIETNDRRLENIIIKLIEQQKKTQLELKHIRGYIEGIKDIMTSLTQEK